MDLKWIKVDKSGFQSDYKVNLSVQMGSLKWIKVN